MPKRWQDLAAPDDPSVWTALSNQWPTRRGTYETADVSTSTQISLGAATDAPYAFAAGNAGTGPQEYVLLKVSGALRAYSWDGTTLTSRFLSSNFSTDPRGLTTMVKFGSSVLMSAYTSLALTRIQSATWGGSFADQATDAPNDKIILAVQSSCILAFSHLSNAFQTSDVGGGNWTASSSSEATSGTLYLRAGNTTAAVSYGNDVYAFKPGSIIRLTYVGGTVKWQAQVAWDGLGVPDRATLSVTNSATQDWAIKTNHGIAFYGGNGNVYLFDGSSEPRLLNPFTTIPVETIRGVFTYDPVEDRLCIAPGNGSSATGTALTEGGSSTYSSLYYYYSFPFDAWGSGCGNAGELQTRATGNSNGSSVLRGDYYDRYDKSSKPVYWQAPDGISVIVRNAPSAPSSSTVSYLQSHRVGAMNGKTTFQRLIPILRRRTNLGSGTAALTFDRFLERDSTSTSGTSSVTESTARERFDLGPTTDTYGRFKVTWTGLDVEVDDFMVLSDFLQGAE